MKNTLKQADNTMHYLHVHKGSPAKIILVLPFMQERQNIGHAIM